MCRSKESNQARIRNQSSDSIVTDDEQSKTLLQNQRNTITSILTKNAMSQPMTDDDCSIGAATRYKLYRIFHILSFVCKIAFVVLL